MIKLENVSKEFITAKKYPGFKGAVKGLFSNEKETKKVCKKDLPDYMQPFDFCVFDSLPKTPIGKIDYQRLERWDRT